MKGVPSPLSSTSRYFRVPAKGDKLPLLRRLRELSEFLSGVTRCHSVRVSYSPLSFFQLCWVAMLRGTYSCWVEVPRYAYVVADPEGEAYRSSFRIARMSSVNPASAKFHYRGEGVAGKPINIANIAVQFHTKRTTRTQTLRSSATCCPTRPAYRLASWQRPSKLTRDKKVILSREQETVRRPSGLPEGVSDDMGRTVFAFDRVGRKNDLYVAAGVRRQRAQPGVD